MGNEEQKPTNWIRLIIGLAVAGYGLYVLITL
jgi:hypothetical protein